MEVEGRQAVLDLTRARQAPAVEVECSEAAEVLMSMWALTAPDPSEFLIGASRLARLRAEVPAQLLEAAGELRFGTGMPVFLVGLVCETPRPRLFPAFLERLRETEPVALQLHLLGYHVGDDVADPEVIRRAAAGDAAAGAELVRLEAEVDEERHRVVEALLGLGAEAVKQRLLDVLPAWYEEVFRALSSEALPAMERDAEAKRRLALSVGPEQLLHQVAPGLRYAPETDVRKVVLFPTYWARPWVVSANHGDVRIFCYPIAGDGARAPDDPEALARIYKALGDGSRLRLLKLLREGPATLSEAADRLGIAKSTAHHHFAILRQSGLVAIVNGEGGLYYSLQPDAAAQTGGLLSDYLR
jgi:DNA-binding transcriptional ArsR family regulator